MHQIPARIIQTAKTRHLSVRDRAVTANLKLLNPDCEWAFFDDQDVERFVDSEFPQYRQVFDSFRYPIQRFDFFRYLAVFRLGGFYFDLDVLLASDLGDLRTHGCVFPFEGLTHSHLLRGYGMDWEIGNYAFGAAADHPFLKAVIENCVRAQRDPNWIAPMMRGAPMFSSAEYLVLYSTGPGLVSRTLVENPGLANSVTVLFPDDVSDMRTWNMFGTYGVHLMDGSWRPSTSVLRRRVAQTWEAWMTNRLVTKSRQRGKTRQVTSIAACTKG